MGWGLDWLGLMGWGSTQILLMWHNPITSFLSEWCGLLGMEGSLILHESQGQFPIWSLLPQVPLRQSKESFLELFESETLSKGFNPNVVTGVTKITGNGRRQAESNFTGSPGTMEQWTTPWQLCLYKALSYPLILAIQSAIYKNLVFDQTVWL